jgi:hypothetical protein
MAKYKWVEGCRLPLDPQIVGTELEKIRKKNKGNLTKEAVVAEAKNPLSPLHDGFEWDDDKAAEAFRLVQAGYMIRHVTVVFEDPTDEIEHEIRAFVSVKQEDEEKVSYTSMQIAMEDPELRSQVFKQALDEINRWKTKYRHLTLFARIFGEIDAVNDMIADSYTPKTRTIKVAKMKN